MGVLEISFFGFLFSFLIHPSTLKSMMPPWVTLNKIRSISDTSLMTIRKINLVNWYRLLWRKFWKKLSAYFGELRTRYRLLQYNFFCFKKEFILEESLISTKNLVCFLKCNLSNERESCRVDVAFDVYEKNSIKYVERNKHSRCKLHFPQIIPEETFIFQWK